MGRYIEIEVEGVSSDLSDILIAELTEAGFEGFEELPNGLKAFIPEADYDRSELTALLAVHGVTWKEQPIADTNWNAVWESNFDPVIVDDFIAVRAGFHEPVKGVESEIVITPKMSFGTGHHATTYMMLQQMRAIDFSGKTVLDFGTGTGVLAILAEKRGASEVLAIDHDEWSIDNAAENLERNNCHRVTLRRAGNANLGRKFDVILANINKNVIIDNFTWLAEALTPGGILLFSGLLPEDQDDIFHMNEAYSLQLIQTVVRANWLCIKYSR